MTDPTAPAAPALVTRVPGDVVTFAHRGEILTGAVRTVGPQRIPFSKRHATVFSCRLGILVPGHDWMVWADSDDTVLAREESVTAVVEWTHRDHNGTPYGTMRFLVPTALSSQLTAQGKTVLWRVASTQYHTTALTSRGARRYRAKGTLDEVARAAAAWLGLTGPLTIRQGATATAPAKRKKASE
ncbi:hypothetical protein AB0E08_07530 [Streptomyces sp. NPDC048281]|uniref:hypothetical protein n=1 Tax=Streptomyces sp. NPDC048281 TaxID=3154715 RepID=UPI003428E1B8